MSIVFIPFLILAALLLFVLIWFLVVTLLRKISGMTTDNIEEFAGAIISDSGWGHARINGIRANNCVKLIEYHDGYLLKMMYIFGNGKLWIEKGKYVIEEDKPKRNLIFPEMKKITWDDNKVYLYGKLASSISSIN